MWCLLSRHASLAAIRRRVDEQAMGRMDESFFRRANSLAPNRIGLISAGTVALWMMSTTLANEVASLRAVEPRVGASKSFKCLGRKASGPAEELAGKEATAESTSSAVVLRADSACRGGSGN